MNSSGPISLAGTTAGVSIEIENGGNGTTMISLNDAAVRSLAGVPSGAITMPTDFYGKANQFSFTISSNTSNANLRSLAVTAGWNASSKVVATINSGVYVYSNSTGTPGLTVNGSFPGGVSLVNNGTILGMGGAGGGGQAGNGNAGGTALLVSTALSVTNNNIIGGGGGGGGGSAYYCYSYYACCYGYTTNGAGSGGGGGRTGLTNSSGGSAFNGSGGNGNAGSAGTSSSGGNGGAGTGSNRNKAGGAGGTWGASGSSGQSCPCFCYWHVTSSSGAGGGGGKATCGAGTYITWVATGTRYGSVS
jgi:hypothetical protein